MKKNILLAALLLTGSAFAKENIKPLTPLQFVLGPLSGRKILIEINESEYATQAEKDAALQAYRLSQPIFWITIGSSLYLTKLDSFNNKLITLMCGTCTIKQYLKINDIIDKINKRTSPVN